MRIPTLLGLCALLGACASATGTASPARPAQEPLHSAAAIDGEVLGVDRVPPSDKLASGVVLRVQPGSSAAVVVDLAPDWYLDAHGLRFAPAERVHVEGSRVQKKSGVVIYATRVRKGTQTLELRHPDSGAPLWGEPPR